MKHNIAQGAIYAGVLVFAVVGAALAQTPVTTCGTVINAPGTYELANDLTNCSWGVNIAASNVTLLLNGHTISGAGPWPNSTEGIVMSTCFPWNGQTCPPLTNVAVEGPGLITNFGFDGVAFVQTSSLVEYVTVTKCQSAFTLGNGSTNNQLINNTASGNSGIGFNTASGNVFKGNISTGNNWGFMVTADNTIRGNTANNNGFSGIKVPQGYGGNTITYNTAKGNGTRGGYDLEDDNVNCHSNIWKNNTFGAANKACIQ